MPKKGQTSAFDGRQMARFVTALESGATIAAAAAAARVPTSTLYYRRDRDPAFAEAWAEAAAKSAGPALVMGQCGRRYQKQQSRRVRFTRDRKQAFLDHFAGCCNLAAAAAAAGVSADAVYDHLMNDAAFAEGFQAALEIGYRLLEAEAVGQQRAAQEAYRINPTPDAAFGQSFERTMQLLREYNRGGGAVGRRAPRRGDPRSRWSFDEALAALEKELAAMGVEIPSGGEDDAATPQAEPAPDPLPHEAGADVPRISAALSGGQGDLLISEGPPVAGRPVPRTALGLPGAIQPDTRPGEDLSG